MTLMSRGLPNALRLRRDMCTMLPPLCTDERAYIPFSGGTKDECARAKYCCQAARATAGSRGSVLRGVTAIRLLVHTLRRQCDFTCPPDSRWRQSAAHWDGGAPYPMVGADGTGAGGGPNTGPRSLRQRGADEHHRGSRDHDYTCHAARYLAGGGSLHGECGRENCRTGEPFRPA